jgi:hypothetical protein
MQWYNNGITMTSLTINTSNCRWKHKIEAYLFPIIKIFFKNISQVNTIIINKMWLFLTLCENIPENSTINPKLAK